MAFDYDVIVIGAGHNALISAGYLAQSGYHVGVFEKRDLVGGAVSTKEIIPGFKFDLGGSAHILIRLTPIVEELNLYDFGLEYIELDPLFFSSFRDGDSFYIYRDVAETIEHLESKYPGEGDSYKHFVDAWRPFAQVVRNTFLETPSPFNLGKSFALNSSLELDWQEALRFILQPYGDVVDHYFNEEKIKSSLVWMAAQSGPPPSEALTAPFLLWHPLYHEGGIARPKGGSGMLTQALQRHIESHGGEVHLNAPVTEILIESKKAVGVRVNNTIYTSRKVLAGTHVLESIGKLLPAKHRPPSLDQMRVGNGFGAILRLALSEPIKYSSDESLESRIGLQLLCENRQQIYDAYADFLRGEPTENPPLVAMTFSAVDDTLVPPGGEVLWLWGQYYPYELRGEQTWGEIGDRVAENMIDTFEKYAPGTREKIVGQLFQHPLWLERELGLYRGNVMHLEMSLDQMFSMRPSAEMSQYRTHIDGLYLTGASTHPGGGIMGASGRNAARVVLKDLDRRYL